MEKITKHINRIQRAITCHRSRYFEKYGLQGQFISFLLAVNFNPGLSQEDLTEWLNINKSTVTRNIVSLIDLGYITREVDERDKRGYKLFPTEKLKDFIPTIKEYLDDYNRELLSDLSDEEKDIFVKALIKVGNKAFESIEVKHD